MHVMEQDNKKQILRGECPRKLKLNVPLSSTRRRLTTDDNMLVLLPAESNTTTSKETSNMVPFSWERIPGQPKNDNKNMSINSLGNIDQVPPSPKPPRAWWQPPAHAEEISSLTNHAVDHDGTWESSDHHFNEEEEFGHRNNGHFSDTIDIFSLADESAEEDDMEANYQATKGRSLEEPLEPSDGGGYHSPNFIIQRFLPDAQALAEASVMNKNTLLSSPPHSTASFSRAVSIRRSYHSPKGCGLGSFLPWRIKPKPCTVKSPICDTIIGANHKQNR